MKEMTNLNSRGLDKVAHSISKLDLVPIVNHLSIEVDVGGPHGQVQAPTQGEHQDPGVPGPGWFPRSTPLPLETIGS